MTSEEKMKALIQVELEIRVDGEDVLIDMLTSCPTTRVSMDDIELERNIPKWLQKSSLSELKSCVNAIRSDWPNRTVDEYGNHGIMTVTNTGKLLCEFEHGYRVQSSKELTVAARVSPNSVFEKRIQYLQGNQK